MNKIISPLKPNAEGDAVADLQDLLQLCLGKAELLSADEAARKRLAANLKPERKKRIYGEVTRELVDLFQKERGLTQTGAVDEPTANALNELWQKWQPLPTEPAGEKTAAKVTGTIILEHGSPASKVKVLLYQRGFGGTKTLLKEEQTDEHGAYVIPYSTHGKANIEIYAVGADGTEVQLSRTQVGAQAEERIDLIAPSRVQPAAAEFARLTSAVAPHIGNKPEALRDAVERGERRDLTNLAAATGWDAAAIALAAEAHDGAVQTKIPAEGLYALARAGLPMDVKLLASMPKQTVANTLRQAAEAGIMDASNVDKSVEAFVEFATKYKFNNKISGALSSPKDFVNKARIPSADRTAFEKLIQEDATGNLWERAKTAGVSDAGIKNLQLQGKLAYLTFNNVEVADYLATQIKSDTMELIKLGFYDETKWAEALRKLTGGDDAKLGALIPPAFAGRNVEERLLEYSTELARRVQQMDPHAVTVDRIAVGKIGGVAEREGVKKFLENAVPLGFRLGTTPLGAFVAKNKGTLWRGTEKKEEVLDSVRTLSALYATSPSDEALSALLLSGFKSATDIAKHDLVDFDTLIKKNLPQGPKGRAPGVSEKIFWKAQQQAATVFNVFDGLKRLNSVGPVIGSTPQEAAARDRQIATVREELSGLFPTLENLFGSVDYCQCNHCQSVLSPAAYLVDVLHFIDPKDEAWVMAKASYLSRTGFPYEPKLKPFDALNNRRPDIKNIALTCENTHTALPYIDIVNEVLEQLMMSDTTPPAIEAYDVGDISSADLLAEPQNILWDAYVGTGAKPSLRKLVYPATLPFDLPLEMARAFLKQLDLPLWRLREYLAKPTTLNPSASGKTDGWVDVWFERLGFGPYDVAQLTRATEWYSLYGYATQSDALKMKTEGGVLVPTESSLGNAKTLARRLGVTYEELVELLRTRFINPEIENLIVLKGLGIDPSTVDRYFGESPALTSTDKSEFETTLEAQGVTAEQLHALRTDAIRKVTLELRSPSFGCDFSQTTLAFDKAPADLAQAMAFALRKMNAFVRLQRKLGWEIHELDRALMALMPGVAGVTMSTWASAMKTALIYLAHVEELRVRFEDRLTREEIITLWSDIPTLGISCLYERLFMAPGAAERNEVFKKKLGKVLQDAGGVIDHADAVRQAFGLAHENIEPILEAASAANRVLSIENLSILMRYAVLAKGLGLSIPDLLALMKLSERKPLSSLDAAALTDLAKDVPWSETLEFVREVNLLREAGVDLTFLERLCRYQGVIEQPVAEKDPVLIALAALPPADPTPTDNQQILVVQTLAAQLSVSEPIIDTLLGSVLKDSAGDPLKETGFSDSVKAAASLLKLRRAIDLVQSLGISKDELEYLIGVTGNLDPNDLPVTVVTDYVAAKALRKGLMGWLEFAAARKQFQQSERMLAVLIAATQPIDTENTLAVRMQQLHQAMTALTGFQLPGLAQSLEAIGAKPEGSSGFKVLALAGPAQLRKTIEALKGLVKLGLHPNEMVAFASNAIDKEPAQKLRSSVKAKYTASAWRGVAKPIFDGLRKKQRDALVAHLTHVMDAAGTSAQYGDTAEKLFEYLLLDPGMEPVVDASRIQLAINSVQLFVQRCLMNLEKDVTPQIIDNKRWEWMRRYRVWEVNRKMYIWPENWLDPEFRDDKTHLFRDLEGQLLQGDVNDDLVRTALHSYVKGLEEIARLQMLTMYFEPGASADGSIIHVVGRTPNAPHKYFYRKVSHGMWTPWEPIDVGIEGEHLVLTAWRGRMYLFWVSFLEQSKENPDASLDMPSEETAKADRVGISQVKLQLHWVEQVQGKWVGRNSTPNFVDTDFDGLKATDDGQKSKFFVHAVVIEHEAGAEDDELEIQIRRGKTAHKFVFFSKLAPPRSGKTTGNSLVLPPFMSSSPTATKWRIINQALRVEFVSAVTQNSEHPTSQSRFEAHKLIGGTGEATLLFPNNGMLSISARTPPTGVGRPTGYVFKPKNAQHVVYRSGDGAIHDLYRTKNGWVYQSPSTDALVSDTANDVEPASGDPHGYSLDDQGTICIAYAGKTKLQELVWSQLDFAFGDSTLGTGWRLETPYKSTTSEDQPVGRPFGGIFLPRRGAAFRTRDGRLRAFENSHDGSWKIHDLNKNLPKTDSDPSGLLVTRNDRGITSIVSRHIFYLGDDGDVHELKSDPGGQNWAHTNITKGMAGIVKPAPGSALAAYAFQGLGMPHVIYRGKDDRIHELSEWSGFWKYSPIGSGFTPAKGDPATYATEWASTQHVVYRGMEDEVVELRWENNRWRENVLSKSATLTAPKSKSDVAGYGFEWDRSQHVVYFSEAGSPCELSRDKSGWHKGGYELENPFPDDVGLLASPFFYESALRDHTFFVEPYVIETTVQEWTGWIVTTEEEVDPPREHPPVKVIPEAIDFEPSAVSLVKNKFDHYAKTVYGEGVVVRTSKGVIAPSIKSSAHARVVDVKKGTEAIDPQKPNNRFGGPQ